MDFIKKRTSAAVAPTPEEPSGGATPLAPPVSQVPVGESPGVDEKLTLWDKPAHPEADQPIEPAPTLRPTAPSLVNRARHLVRLYFWLLIGALVFFILSDLTAFMAGELRPGQVVFSNSMTQLWTGLFRATLVIGGALMLLRLLQSELFEYFRPDRANGPDMIDDFLHRITPFQRICVFWFVFFLLCLVLVLIQLVNLPPDISTGR